MAQKMTSRASFSQDDCRSPAGHEGKALLKNCWGEAEARLLGNFHESLSSLTSLPCRNLTGTVTHRQEEKAMSHDYHTGKHKSSKQEKRRKPTGWTKGSAKKEKGWKRKIMATHHSSKATLFKWPYPNGRKLVYAYVFPFHKNIKVHLVQSPTFPKEEAAWLPQGHTAGW